MAVKHMKQIKGEKYNVYNHYKTIPVYNCVYCFQLVTEKMITLLKMNINQSILMIR